MHKEHKPFNQGRSGVNSEFNLVRKLIQLTGTGTEEDGWDGNRVRGRCGAGHRMAGRLLRIKRHRNGRGRLQGGGSKECEIDEAGRR